MKLTEAVPVSAICKNVLLLMLTAVELVPAAVFTTFTVPLKVPEILLLNTLLEMLTTLLTDPVLLIRLNNPLPDMSIVLFVKVLPVINK